MKLTVLVDNNTLIDRYFLGEPGVSYYIEDQGTKVLFDAGYSDAFIRNAARLGIDLLDLDFIVLSHSHLDHTWGLVPLIRLFTEARTEGRHPRKPTLVTHPLTLARRTWGELPEIGSLLREDELSAHFSPRFTREPLPLNERLVFLGEIARIHDFEAGEPIGRIVDAGVEEPDLLADDSALVYRSAAGLVVITGCSHAGICNIVESARRVCRQERVAGIVGGFHLLNPSARQLEGTLAYLAALSPARVHACHCTDLASKIALSKCVDLREVGAGLTLDY